MSHWNSLLDILDCRSEKIPTKLRLDKATKVERSHPQISILHPCVLLGTLDGEFEDDNCAQ